MLKLEQEEDQRRRQTEVHAAPLPSSTFRPCKPTPTRIPRKLILPVGPTLRTESQARHHNEFARELQKKREEQEKSRRLMEEQQQAEWERQIWELRRRPVSEGGLLQVAKPIGAVFN